MASLPSTSTKSEPAGVLFSVHQSTLTLPTRETGLSSHADDVPSSPSSIDTASPLLLSQATSVDVLQSLSAPMKPVYINSDLNDRSSNTIFSEITTVRSPPPLPTSLTTDADVPLSPALIQKYNQHHYHHFPHHQPNRNRYPYLQRLVIARSIHQTDSAITAAEAVLPVQRPAFRRAYFALRKPRIPKAPPMPKHLLPGYKQNRTAISTTGSNKDENGNKDEEDEDQAPSRSFLTILRLVFFFFAIEFMYAVETALTVPILNTLRVPESFYSMAWLISPILGFFLQPIIGMWSDTCKCRWGRRRPFILAFAIGAYIGVALLLNSSDLGVLLGDPTAPDTIPYKAVILTAVGVTFLDFCADSADAPVRAYLIDTMNPTDQERGFNIHAILGFGGGLGFIVGAMKWPKIPMFYSQGGIFSIIFYFASFLFIVCSIATLTSVREEPLISSSRKNNLDVENSNDDEDGGEIETNEKLPLLSLHRDGSNTSNTRSRQGRSTANLYLSALNKQEGFLEIDPATGNLIPHNEVENTMNRSNTLPQTLERSYQLAAATLSNNDPSNVAPTSTQAFEAELIQTAKLVKLGLKSHSSSLSKEAAGNDDDDDKDNVTIKSMLISMVRMPSRLWKLMICQVIGWIAYFATHLYFTDFVAKTVYNGTYEHPSDPGFEAYQHGVTMGCWGLFVYSASTAVYAFCLERWLADRISLKVLYFTGYVVYAVGCIVNYFVINIVVNIIMCVTFGMLVVSLNTIPYHMLSQFHTDETYKNRDGSKRGIGIDCSLLNSCYFLGEFVVAVGLGPILERTGVTTCMLIGAGFSIIGNICMVFLFFFKN